MKEQDTIGKPKKTKSGIRAGTAPVVNGMERKCQRHGSDQTPSPVRVQKSCVNQFILNNICSRGAFVISHSELRNCVIVAIIFLQQLIDAV